MEAEGLRDKMIVVCGGPRISHELAKELGYDAGFGANTYADDVASFVAQEFGIGLTMYWIGGHFLFKGINFSLQVVAHLTHDGVGIVSPILMKDMAERVIVTCNEIGNVGSPLGVNIHDTDFDTQELGTFDIDIVAIHLAKLEALVGIAT